MIKIRHKPSATNDNINTSNNNNNKNNVNNKGQENNRSNDIESSVVFLNLTLKL